MFRNSSIPLERTGAISPFILDYIHKKKGTQAFYGEYPDQQGFSSALKKVTGTPFDRNTLHAALLLQAKSVSNNSEASLRNIDLIKQAGTVTVTTGHQLCLFTGPLYFIYKIISAINLAEKMKREYPQNDFVPVYWMAAEDHDFAEVDHFFLFGKKLQWESNEKGSVGDFTTAGLRKVLDELKSILGETSQASSLTDLFEKSYLGQKDLASATRYLVNALFGKYGLVIADGSQKELKHIAKDFFIEEFFAGKAYELVMQTNSEIERAGYKTQVKPRDVNFFYKEKGTRLRFEKNESGFGLVGSSVAFSAGEMKTLIRNHPEKISPNVVTRPLYQQIILPNIAYVGGPGELNYWLQYKRLFDHYGVNFPVLVLRNTVSIIDRSQSSRLRKFGLQAEDLFKEENELISAFLNKSGSVPDFDQEMKDIAAAFEQIRRKMSAIDKTLEGTVSAEEKKALDSIQHLAQRRNRALRQKEETSVSQLKLLKAKFLPGGSLAERQDNFSGYYSKWGQGLMDHLKDSLNPLEFSHLIIEEE